MEENKSTSQIVTENEVWKGDLNMLKEEGETVEKTESKIETIKAPLFIMFAEYMGYISKFIEDANNWCDGKKQNKIVVRILELDAFNIFQEMKSKYSVKEIREWYDELYDVILSSYDENLKKLEEKEKSGEEFISSLMEDY